MRYCLFVVLELRIKMDRDNIRVFLSVARAGQFGAGLSATFRWNELWLQQAERTANAYTPDGNRE
jgi:hypothetical protein